MTYAVIDVETSIFQRGNPFSECNKLCLIGIRINASNTIIEVEYDSTKPYAEGLALARRLIGSVDTVVLFNAKFDLNWLARYDIILGGATRVFDCQLAEFILGNQRPAYPSLDDCVVKYGVGHKSSYINDTYWSAGIDTPQIPLNELKDYLTSDLEQTDALYNVQLDRIPKSKQRLISLHCEDLRVLQEMEFNGQLFSWDTLADAQVLADGDLKKLDSQIREFVPEGARDAFNIDSGDHLSILLYGGSLRGKRSTPYQRVFKSGPRLGETATANRWETYTYEFPRLVNPPDGSQLKKEGFYSTDEETLLSLTRAKPLVRLLLRRAEVAKFLQTYLQGFPKIRDKYDWQDDMLHTTFNQCRVITGRLSSEKPNMQNMPSEMNEYIISRFS